MTTLYRPVLIESAEQAEALPEGTPIWDERPERRRAIVDRGYAVTVFGKRAVDVGTLRYFPREVVGWTALVPINAEEERQAIAECEIGVPGTERIVHEHRFVTPWEER